LRVASRAWQQKRREEGLRRADSLRLRRRNDAVFDRCRDAGSLSDRRLFSDGGTAPSSIPKAL